jgi:tetratricopeptide (TPR) repeat protein/predicted aspartyl protease
MRRTLLALFAALITSSSANAACKLGKLVEFKVTMEGTQPQTDIGINGHSLPFIIDSGAFFSSMSLGTAQQLGLPLTYTPLKMLGIGGETGTVFVAHAKSVVLAGIPLHDLEFLVGGSETGSGGLLGQNILGIADVEYDLGHGAIRLMRPEGCSANVNYAYWAGQTAVSDLDIEPRNIRHPHTTATIFVNGVKVRAVFDTGSGSSILSLSAAKRMGLTPSSQNVTSSGLIRGLGRSMVSSWLAPVDSVMLGSEEVRNIKLHIGNLSNLDADMLIGSDFFLSHRIYVANASRKMYFTYDGGPVFDSMPSRIVDHQGVAQTIAADTGPEPTDAAGFSRRGAAETSRREYKEALSDFGRAIAMEPGNAKFLLQRAQAQFLAGNQPAAFADMDQAVKVAPTDPEIHLARAASLFERKEDKAALTDLEFADAELPSQADQRLVIATLFEQIDQFDKAISDFDMWIANHPDDSKRSLALNGRCWTRALAGRDLPLALKDCNAAIGILKASSYLDSRGLVELRMGQFSRAITDYNQALKLSPKTAWSLYGRGIARRHENDPGSQDDLKAAAAIDPKLPARADALGIN